MKRFVWRLQRVLDVKEKEEQVKTTQLMALTEKLVRARGELLAQQRILRDILDDIATKKGGSRLSQQELFLKYCATTDERIKGLKEKAGELERQQREKIEELLKVRRFKEGLERLRAEAKRRFIQEQEKLEQKQLDETATIGFTRRMAEAANAAESDGRGQHELID
jgi:flagellar export protein FliJ